MYICIYVCICFKKINMEFTRGKYQIFIQVVKNVDYMESSEFSSRAEISSRLAKPS